ncbi:hypothetical protein D3C73_717830 [compost metagenome]
MHLVEPEQVDRADSADGGMRVVRLQMVRPVRRDAHGTAQQAGERLLPAGLCRQHQHPAAGTCCLPDGLSRARSVQQSGLHHEEAGTQAG